MNTYQVFHLIDPDISNIIEDFFRHRATIARHRIIWYHEKVFKPRRDKNGDNPDCGVYLGSMFGIETEKGKHDYTVPAARNSRGAPEFIGGLIVERQHDSGG